ncbi:M23 family metallopeptidase [Aliiruegeria sabulilitoris]|uniref:M23 family metallopeptidase n=1 Tax=Aliiruegeria sabulilitoris TaxID=1510458 RepID=UPI00082AEE48|nr:M23 family metallopeptidase [Aliiruegeria sabulilitoris]NDR57206.1 M23 family metallopeptidase [Pseudoruegeria sp. M32A2M]
MAGNGRSGTGRLRAPFLCLLAFPALADVPATPPPALLFPVDCSETNCRITRYVDRDPGPGAIEHSCGALTSDAHKGTDIAVAPGLAFGDGIAVRAAATGRVRGIRDNMPDIEIENPNAPDVSARECGNGIVIAHGDGWETQYCHLRRGSVSVRKGEMVEAGAPIGQIGMSGKASAPHLHFSFRFGKQVIDPFRADAGKDCGATSALSAWQAGDIPAYRPGGLIQIGLLDRVPDFPEILAGLPGNALPEAAPEAIVLWGLFFGGQERDRMVLTLSGEAGLEHSRSFQLERDQPLFYRANGLNAPKGGFPPGTYRAHVAHWRGARLLEKRKILFELP